MLLKMVLYIEDDLNRICNMPFITFLTDLKKHISFFFLFALGIYFLAFQFSVEEVYLSSFAFFTSSHNKTSLSKSLPFFLITKRFMWKRLVNSLPKSSHQNLPPLQNKGYATYRVHTPEATTTSNESLTNNPVTALRRKTKTIVTQHPEIVEDFCILSGCKNKLCLGLCEKKAGPSKSIAHATHSDREDISPIKLSDKDLAGDNRPQYAIFYKKPHETSGESVDPIVDAEKTKKLLAIMKEIEKNNK